MWYIYFFSVLCLDLLQFKSDLYLSKKSKKICSQLQSWGKGGNERSGNSWWWLYILVLRCHACTIMQLQDLFCYWKYFLQHKPLLQFCFPNHSEVQRPYEPNIFILWLFTCKDFFCWFIPCARCAGLHLNFCKVSGVCFSSSCLECSVSAFFSVIIRVLVVITSVALRHKIYTCVTQNPAS